VRGLLVLVALVGCQRTDEGSGSRTVDCGRVAETLASFEVGRHATPQARAPAAARYRRACEATDVTAAEARCLYAAKDTWAARACLPRMFAGPADAHEEPSCAVVTSRMRAAVLAQIGSAGSAGHAAVERMLPVIRAACEQDGWPPRVVQCISATKVGDMESFQACSNQLPKPLQDKLAQRLAEQQQAPK
jgi:hypothetical protein